MSVLTVEKPLSSGRRGRKPVDEVWEWGYDSFCAFYEQLTLPSGLPARLEGFQRLILREIFEPDRVETLILIPKGHAKTTVMAALADFHLAVTINANGFIGASDRIQADEMYRFAAHFAETDPILAENLRVLRGTREIRNTLDQGFVRVLASDDSKQGGKRQGFNPTLALLDELHAHENDNLYSDMRSGLFKRKGSLVTITTAGWDQESVLGRLRTSFLDCEEKQTGLMADETGDVFEAGDGRLTIARKPSGKSAMLEWAVLPEDDLGDLDAVKLANPASWVDMESLEDAKESLSPWTFARYRANRWTLGYESWLPEGAWDALLEPGVGLDPDLPVVAALDMARYRDSAALVAVQLRPDAPAVVSCQVWRPGGPDNPVSYEDVKRGILDLHETYDLTAMGFDPKYFDQAAEELTDAGVAMELFPQSNERMCPAVAGLRSAILSGELAHDGDPVLGRHVMAAVAKEIGENLFKLTKTRTNGPDIDAAEALAMAYALSSVEAPKVGVAFW